MNKAKVIKSKRSVETPRGWCLCTLSPEHTTGVLERQIDRSLVGHQVK